MRIVRREGTWGVTSIGKERNSNGFFKKKRSAMRAHLVTQRVERRRGRQKLVGHTEVQRGGVGEALPARCRSPRKLPIKCSVSRKKKHGGTIGPTKDENEMLARSSPKQLDGKALKHEGTLGVRGGQMGLKRITRVSPHIRGGPTAPTPPKKKRNRLRKLTTTWGEING